MMSQRHYCLWLAQHWPAAALPGASWNRLFSMWGQLLVSSHRSHPCSLPTTKTLPHKPNTEV